MKQSEKQKIRKNITALPTITLKVRAVAKMFGEYTLPDIEDFAPYLSTMQIKGAFANMKRTGEHVIIEPGRYRYQPRNITSRTYNDIMWHLVRSHRFFDTGEIERLSGAKRSTVLEFLGFLKRAGIIKKTSMDTWQMINDPGPDTPVNEAKREKLKRIRENKKPPRILHGKDTG